MMILNSDPKKPKKKPELTAEEEKEKEAAAIIQNEDEAATNTDTAVINVDLNGVPATEPLAPPTAQEEHQQNMHNQEAIAEVEEQERIVNVNQNEITKD